jgi:NTE family protein
MSTPDESSSFQYAHAVFAGGGVRGLAHVGALEVAEQLGYHWQHVAGTSAGAIIAALVAAGYSAHALHTIMQEIDYARFAANPHDDLLHITEVSNLLTHGGLHDGSYIETFVREKLLAQGVHTFGDLRVPGQEQHPDLFQRYRLTVIVSDITQGRIVRLPQDAHLYGIDPNALDVARAVRMSASIPFFFMPLQLTNANGVRSCIVDGGLLSNFPLFLFEHDFIAHATALPTFGFQLVDTAQQPVCESEGNNGGNVPCGIDMLKALIRTMLSAHDRLYMNDETLAHTIAIPTHGIASTQFDLTQEQAQQLYESGKTAATTFFKTWDFEAFMAMYRSGNTPNIARLAQVHQTMKEYAQGYSSCKDV